MNNTTENKQRIAAKQYVDYITALELRTLRPHIAARTMAGMPLTYCQRLILRKWSRGNETNEQEPYRG